MSKAGRNRAQAARERIAAQQAAARRAQQRRRGLIAGGSILAVLALIAAIVVVKLAQPSAKAGPVVASRALAARVTGVPAATFNAVGAGTSAGLRKVTRQPALALGGKPEVLYVGGEFCPYCAAERWAIAAAVSRFSQLSGLHFIHSAPDDSYPDTPTLSFYRSGFTSKYIAFVPVELYGEGRDASTPLGHVYLQRPTAQEAALYARYSGGAIPFLDIANQYLLPTTSYVPSALAGLSWSQVAAAMHDPGSAVGQDIDGAANIITAGICAATGGQPGNVCGSPGVTRSAGSL